MAFAAALIAEREDDAGLLAYPRNFHAFADRVGDRLVEEDVLAGVRGLPRRLEMHIVRRGVDDRFDRRIGEDRFIALRLRAAVFFRESRALVGGAREAGHDLELVGAFAGVGEHIRPPANPKNGDA